MPPSLPEAIASVLRLEAELLPLATRAKAIKEELAPHYAAIAEAALAECIEDERGTRRAYLATPAGVASVTFPIAALKLTPENFEAARKLAGATWAKLAQRVELPWKLLKTARDIVPAVLTPARAAKLLALLCTEPASPRIEVVPVPPLAV